MVQRAGGRPLTIVRSFVFALERIATGIESSLLPWGSPLKLANIVCLTLVLVPATCLSNESFRCGTRIVTSEMPLETIRRLCGEPTTKTSETRPVRAVSSPWGHVATVGTTTLETWTYVRGTRSFPIVIRIEDGKIKSIKSVK